ncbi:MAG: hypothetical protein HY996_12445 [Micrococcales bacterium]|nr:hypothetical protein [Micrococcales bacterium]
MANTEEPDADPGKRDERADEQDVQTTPAPTAPAPAFAAPAPAASAPARSARPPRRWWTFSLFLVAALLLGGFAGGAIGATVVATQTHSTRGPDRTGDFRDQQREHRGFGPGQNGGERGPGRG